MWACVVRNLRLFKVLGSTPSAGPGWDNGFTGHIEKEENMNFKRGYRWMMVQGVMILFFVVGGLANNSIDTPVYLCYLPSAEASEPAVSQEAQPGSVVAHIKAGDELTKNPKTVENLERAIKEYEAALKIDPDNIEALWKVANAYTYIMQIKSNGIIVEKDEYKPMFKELGKKALDYAEKAREINPKSKEAVTANLRAYAYYCCSFGIIKAVLKGAAGKYKDLAEELIAIDDKHEDGMVYDFLGRLYHVSPWPVGSSKKAMENYLKTVEIAPSRLEAHYFLGVIYLDKKKYDQAKKEFELVVKNPPNRFEEHFIAAFKEDAKRNLALIAEKQK